MRGAVRGWGLRELLYVVLAATDVCLFLPLVAGMLNYIVPVDPARLAVTLLASVLAVHYLARASLAWVSRPPLRAVGLVLAILLSAAAVVHEVLYPELPLLSLAWPVQVVRWLREANLQGLTVPREGFVFLLVVFLWWRGLMLAQRHTSSHDVAHTFRLGVIVLSVTATLGSLILSWAVETVVFAYFFAGLVSIAVARADEAQRQGSDGRSVASFGWFAGLGVAAAAVVVFAAALASIMSGDNLALIVQPLLVAAWAILVGVLFVASLLAEIVGRVARFFFHDIDLDQLREIVGPLRNLRPPRVDPKASRWSIDRLASLRTIVVLGSGILVIVAVTLSVRWLRRRFSGRQGGDIDSVWEGIDVGDALAGLARTARAYLGDRIAGARSRLAGYWTAMTIRRVYGRVLNLAEDRGFPRGASQTPYEFLPILRQAFPGASTPLAYVTEAYVAVHYGEIPEDPSVLAEVAAAWESIRTRSAEPS